MQKKISIPAYIEVEPDTFWPVDKCSLVQLQTAFKNERDIDLKRGIGRAIKTLHNIEMHVIV